MIINEVCLVKEGESKTFVLQNIQAYSNGKDDIVLSTKLQRWKDSQSYLIDDNGSFNHNANDETYS